MIGYYVHHQGFGHVHRAQVLAGALGIPVTGLSSLPRPPGWAGEWVVLARDDTPADTGRDVSAHRRLHWVPRHHPGLASRMAAVSAWIQAAKPEMVIADVSVEVLLLARLHGTPVATVVLPGCRTDAAHQLGFDVAEAVIGMWPAPARGILSGLDEAHARKFHAVGALSRFRPAEHTTRSRAGEIRRITVLHGSGGGGLTRSTLSSLRQAVPDAEVTVLGGPEGTWVDDPWPFLQRADVVVTHAGQNAIAEVAASRTPAVAVALPRPFDEQRYLLGALCRGPWPVVAAPEGGDARAWAAALHRAASLDGRAWRSWNDGRAGARFAEVIAHARRA